MTPDETSQLAAEYALGLLDGADLARAEKLIAENGDFAREARTWAGRFAPLLDEIGSREPPERTFAAIERRLDGSGEGFPVADNVHALRRRVTLWRGFTGAATAIAASLALVLVTRQPPAPPPVPAPPVEAPAKAPLVAQMAADDSDARVIATFDAADRSLVVAAAAGLDPIAGRSHQLWVIPADGTPRSIALLPESRPLYLRLDDPLARLLQDGATIAVSVEPTGGSPTGLPTGPVIAAGPLTQS